MREAAAAPRNSRELAVRNQFFTPRYVVDFLVQNTLGRRLIESDPTSPLLDDLPLLVDPPTEPGPPLDLDDVEVLDPACGSGHFLLGCYDLLERAWELQGVSASESAPSDRRVAVGCRHRSPLRAGRIGRDRPTRPTPLSRPAAAQAQHRHRSEPPGRLGRAPGGSRLTVDSDTSSTASAKCSPTRRCSARLLKAEEHSSRRSATLLSAAPPARSR